MGKRSRLAQKKLHAGMAAFDAAKAVAPTNLPPIPPPAVAAPSEPAPGMNAKPKPKGKGGQAPRVVKKGKGKKGGKKSVSVELLGRLIESQEQLRALQDGRPLTSWEGKAAGSYNDQIEKVRNAFGKQFAPTSGQVGTASDYKYAWVQDVYPAYVIASSDDGYSKVGYAKGADGYTFDTRDKWQKVEQTWTPVASGVTASTGGNSVGKSAPDLGEAYAVKMLDANRISGPAVLYGDADHTDLSAFKDFFTEKTDLLLDSWDKRPMFWDHTLIDVKAELAAAKSRGATPADLSELQELLGYLEAHPEIGTWTKHETKSGMGVWLEGQLDVAHKYLEAIKDLIRRGIVRISSDSAPHLVRRQAAKNGAHELKRWPLAAASLTLHAAEPRLVPVAAIKSMYEALKLPVPAVLDEQ